VAIHLDGGQSAEGRLHPRADVRIYPLETCDADTAVGRGQDHSRIGSLRVPTVTWHRLHLDSGTS
jgi:hypothetical protein